MPPALVISSLASSCSDLVVEAWLPIQIPSSSESEGLHGVHELQRRAAAARVVVGLARSAQAEPELRIARDRDRPAEGHRELDLVVRAVGVRLRSARRGQQRHRRDRHVGDRRRPGLAPQPQRDGVPRRPAQTGAGPLVAAGRQLGDVVVVERERVGADLEVPGVQNRLVIFVLRVLENQTQRPGSEQDAGDRMALGVQFGVREIEIVVRQHAAAARTVQVTEIARPAQREHPHRHHAAPDVAGVQRAGRGRHRRVGADRVRGVRPVAVGLAVLRPHPHLVGRVRRQPGDGRGETRAGVREGGPRGVRAHLVLHVVAGDLGAAVEPRLRPGRGQARRRARDLRQRRLVRLGGFLVRVGHRHRDRLGRGHLPRARAAGRLDRHHVGVVGARILRVLEVRRVFEPQLPRGRDVIEESLVRAAGERVARDVVVRVVVHRRHRGTKGVLLDAETRRRGEHRGVVVGRRHDAPRRTRLRRRAQARRRRRADRKLGRRIVQGGRSGPNPLTYAARCPLREREHVPAELQRQGVRCRKSAPVDNELHFVRRHLDC